MATIKTGQIVTDIRGKAGGSVFSRNAGGAYLRHFVKPNNPNTPKQASNRGLFGTLMSEWRSLSEANQDAWIAAADNYQTKNKVGDVITYSGSQLFCRCNMGLIASGFPQISSIPPNPGKHTVLGLSKTPFPWETLGQGFDEASVLLQGESAAIAADEALVFYASAPQSPGVNSTRTPSYRKLGAYVAADVTGVGAGAATVDLQANYQAVFGDPTLSAGSAVVFVKGFIMFTDVGFMIPIGAQRITIIDGTP